jgi:hypothetical protein
MIKVYRHLNFVGKIKRNKIIYPSCPAHADSPGVYLAATNKTLKWSELDRNINNSA